jgi:hypothetical protein
VNETSAAKREFSPEERTRAACLAVVRMTQVTNVSLILEAQIRTLKAALYINSVYVYRLAANAPFVIHRAAADCASLRCTRLASFERRTISGRRIYSAVSRVHTSV